MNALVITPDRDRDKHDWSGAFRVEADRFVQLHDLRAATMRLSVNISRPAAERRKQVLDALAKQAPGTLDAFVPICHGWRTGVQIGFSLAEIPALAEALAAVGTPHLVVTLYACSTEADSKDQPGTCGDGGFADSLRDELCRTWPAWAGWVDGHTQAGHCVRNPYVRRMEGLACTVGNQCTGGDWLIDPTSPDWKRWYAALHDPDSDLRLRYPFMDREQIAGALATWSLG